MAIMLNHTIVPAHDKEASAEFFADIFGLKYEGAMSHFAPVKVNETLTLDFDNRDRFEMHHYAFHVSDTEVDAIIGRIKKAGIPHGSGPFSQDDMKINTGTAGAVSISKIPTAMCWSFSRGPDCEPPRLYNRQCLPETSPVAGAILTYLKTFIVRISMSQRWRTCSATRIRILFVELSEGGKGRHPPS